MGTHVSHGRFERLKSIKAAIAACVLTALVTSAVTVSEAVAQEHPSTFRDTNGVGIVTKVFDDSTSAAEVEESFRTAKEMGVEWTRVGAAWYHIEREPGHYNWKFLDQTIAMAEKYDINVMMQVTTAPEWATGLSGMSAAQKRSLGHYPDTYAPKPEFYDDYANFFADVVERYAPRGIVDYEVWNEPALAGFWKEDTHNRTPSPESYTQLLKETYPAAHQAYSGVNVIAGGQVVLPTEADGSRINAVDYLKRMYAAGAQGYFDSLAHHPYGIDSQEWIWNGWAYMFNEPKTNNAPQDTLHSVMSANGDGHKEIWLTELGQDTRHGWADEKMQAERYQLYLDAWEGTPNVGPMIFYHLQDKKSYGRSSDKEDYFGVIREDGSWKPAAMAIKSHTNAAESGAVPPAAPAPASTPAVPEVEQGAPVPPPAPKPQTQAPAAPATSQRSAVPQPEAAPQPTSPVVPEAPAASSEASLADEAPKDAPVIGPVPPATRPTLDAPRASASAPAPAPAPVPAPDALVEPRPEAPAPAPAPVDAPASAPLSEAAPAPESVPAPVAAPEAQAQPDAPARAAQPETTRGPNSGLAPLGMALLLFLRTHIWKWLTGYVV